MYINTVQRNTVLMHTIMSYYMLCHVERLLRAFAHMGARSSKTVEIYALDNLIRNDEWNKIT
jgi:hypothetical protein